MKYAILLYADESLNDESPEMMERWNTFTEDTQVQGVFSAGEALWPVGQATTVRVRNGSTATTDGPFAETKEQLGGFYILDLPDLDAAIEWAKKVPLIGWGAVEIRPVVDFSNPEA